MGTPSKTTKHQEQHQETRMEKLTKYPSHELAAIINTYDSMTYFDAIKNTWKYIKRNGLQDKTDKKLINCDFKLKELCDGKDQVHMTEVTKYICDGMRNHPVTPLVMATDTPTAERSVTTCIQPIIIQSPATSSTVMVSSSEAPQTMRASQLIEQPAQAQQIIHVAPNKTWVNKRFVLLTCMGILAATAVSSIVILNKSCNGKLLQLGDSIIEDLSSVITVTDIGAVDGNSDSVIQAGILSANTNIDANFFTHVDLTHIDATHVKLTPAVGDGRYTGFVEITYRARVSLETLFNDNYTQGSVNLSSDDVATNEQYIKDYILASVFDGTGSELEVNFWDHVDLTTNTDTNAIVKIATLTAIPSAANIYFYGSATITYKAKVLTPIAWGGMVGFETLYFENIPTIADVKDAYLAKYAELGFEWDNSAITITTPVPSASPNTWDSTMTIASHDRYIDQVIALTLKRNTNISTVLPNRTGLSIQLSSISSVEDLIASIQNALETTIGNQVPMGASWVSFWNKVEITVPSTYVPGVTSSVEAIITLKSDVTEYCGTPIILTIALI
ncbi:MAG: hypothetical protein Ta2E_02530 [Mycoplasmoidaceae bacterium]|nr:MAG: hypothetical protein Ta2E_02530 [Mycoplasmoidaceae bacterium]